MYKSKLGIFLKTTSN